MREHEVQATQSPQIMGIRGEKRGVELPPQELPATRKTLNPAQSSIPAPRMDLALLLRGCANRVTPPNTHRPRIIRLRINWIFLNVPSNSIIRQSRFRKSTIKHDAEHLVPTYPPAGRRTPEQKFMCRTASRNGKRQLPSTVSIPACYPTSLPSEAV